MAETPTPTEIPHAAQTIPQQTPESDGIAQIIADGEKKQEPPRTILTKIKNAAPIAFSALMVFGALTQLLASVTQDESSSRSH